MIRLRRGRMSCYRYISLLVCLVMMSGLFLSLSPLPAGADTISDLATTLNTLYGNVNKTGMGTISSVYTAAGGLQVTDLSQPPWTQVFASGTGLDVSTLVYNGKYASAGAAELAVASLLRDFAELIYYGGKNVSSAYSSSVLNTFWSQDGATIQNIVGSSVSEADFCSYMNATISDLPTEVVDLSSSGTLQDIQNGTSDLTDPTIDQLMNNSFANALNNTAKNNYPMFNKNASGADWDFGSIINNGFVYVDAAIDPNCLGEIYLMAAIPTIPTTPTPTSPTTNNIYGGHGNVANQIPPPVPPPPASSAVFIARYPGYVALDDMYFIPSSVSGQVPASFVVPAPDAGTLKAAEAQGLEERVYYYNEQYNKWVALASYPQPDGSVLVINDGGYNNVWTEMFAVRQPNYVDITGYWAEDQLNRMNGLALIEGYPISETDPSDTNPLDRTAGPERNMSRAEFTTVLARSLGCLPTPEQKMYGVLLPQDDPPDQVLAGWKGVPDWSQPFVAAMVYSGIIQGVGPYDFDGNAPITRIEAAVLVSKVLSKVPGYQPADLTQFKDAADVPNWAQDAVGEGVLTGYPDGVLAPNNPITRAEAFVTLLKMWRGLGW